MNSKVVHFTSAGSISSTQLLVVKIRFTEANFLGFED